MSAMLERLQRAIGKEVNKYDGWQAYELCHGLANLAADEVNLKNAVSGSGGGGWVVGLGVGDREEEEGVRVVVVAYGLCHRLASQP
jgi:hypothetical protein